MKKTILLFFCISLLSFPQTHKVRPGDTLDSISKKYKISVNQIQARNNFATTRLKVGSYVEVGNDGDHIVLYGENLASIANKHNLSVSKLMFLNNIKNKVIQPGQRLKVRGNSFKGEIKKKKKGKNYFTIKEFVDRSTYQKYGAKSIWFVDEELIDQMNQLRDLFGREIIVNNWANGGSFQWRGLRTSKSSEYSTYSSHSFGRAVDFDVNGISAEQARVKIIQWYNEGILISKSISLEKDVSWVHLDTRNGGGLRVFKP